MISHGCMRCRAYTMGWCEYDPITDTLYPMDEEICTEREERKDDDWSENEGGTRETET